MYFGNVQIAPQIKQTQGFITQYMYEGPSASLVIYSKFWEIINI